ncbi:ribonuclease VapC20 [Geobacter sp. OR-1]|uniref:type II toxin-antitoxin system VapC family toxin n=1 Tax=Geobacter sp. OR-1 TaxID=1266765 RepID=UPI0005443FB0|nr:PIN domain-containing protein [Geobacter sp. OR-1]GAM11495.1 ribonuclease VapC20 [Geobacter sp. OR-1]
MNGIFVDTGAWYALVDSDYADHKAAAAFLAANSVPLITTNFIFSETVTLIRYRIGHDAARSFGQKLQESSFVRIIAVTPPDEERAWETFCKYRDQDFSFVDCTSFAVMERMKLSTAFAFDRHFWVMKFAVVPEKAIK